jgi:hypothetical protein
MDVFDLAAASMIMHNEVAEALMILKHKDEIVRAAYQSGFSKMELHKLTGLARTTIDRIVDQPA